jgi:hypothetical protein
MMGTITISGQQVTLPAPASLPGFRSKYWPHQHYLGFKYPWSTIDEVEKWCWQNFKGRYWRSEGRFFGFKRERDYTLFMLRWM